MNGSTVVGSATLNASGVATLTTASLPAGTYSLVAQYQGSSSFVASTSHAVSVTVNASTATTVYKPGRNPRIPWLLARALTLVATVTTSAATPAFWDS